MPANFGLWLDGEELSSASYGWHQEVRINEDRLHYDPEYYALMTDFIRRSLEYLARELEELDKLSTRL